MIRRLTIEWPGALAEPPEGGRPVRLLAVSDEIERALEDERNREQIAPIDAVMGAGDLEPDYLAFLGDAFRAPLVYVRGNHDRGAGWRHGRHVLPKPLDGIEKVAGLLVAGLSWPTGPAEPVRRDEVSAWRQVLGLARRSILPGPRPQIVISHVPPKGLGDTPADPYHAGFAGYRWLSRLVRPVLWLHGHTALAAAERWRETVGGTTYVNVTGAALIEISPDRRSPVPAGDHAS